MAGLSRGVREQLPSAVSWPVAVSRFGKTYLILWSLSQVMRAVEARADGVLLAVAADLWDRCGPM